MTDGITKLKRRAIKNLITYIICIPHSANRKPLCVMLAEAEESYSEAVIYSWGLVG